MSDNVGAFEQLLLFALLYLGDEDADGGAIRRAIEERTGRAVSPGAVYTAMDRLAGRGFVSSAIHRAPEREGGRRRKYYRLEAAGAQALERSYGTLSSMARGLDGRLADAVSADGDAGSER